MSDAVKCDNCGEYFDIYEKYQKTNMVTYVNIVGLHNWAGSCWDLCKRCRGELRKALVEWRKTQK